MVADGTLGPRICSEGEIGSPLQPGSGAEGDCGFPQIPRIFTTDKVGLSLSAQFDEHGDGGGGHQQARQRWM